MKVLLVKPYNIGDHIQPSLGLMYMATQIRKKHDVVIHDCIKSKTPIDGIVDIVKQYDSDVIGIQCYTFDVPNVYKMLETIKSTFPDKITVIGGAHVSSIPLEAFNQFSPFIDYGFIGEAEIGFPKFLDALEEKKENFADIEGLIWRNKQEQIIMNVPVFEKDLDSLGFPAWDLMPPETYPESQHGAFYEKFPIAPIIITRGCPYRCAFCLAPILSGKIIRRHSVEYIKKHILMLYDRGIREILIVDDNFTFDADYCKQILNGIIDLNLDISLAVPNGIRMDRINDEILELMKTAGVYLISVAVESGSDRILKKMKKATTVEKMRKNIAMIKKHGFPIAGFFILGYPGETRKETEATIRLSKELGLIRANFFTYLPLPGTSSYNELVETKKIDKIDWKNFLFMTAPFVPEGMTRKELLSLKKKAFFSFYLNPRVFIANIRGIKSFSHFKFLLKRFYHWVLMGPST